MLYEIEIKVPNDTIPVIEPHVTKNLCQYLIELNLFDVTLICESEECTYLYSQNKGKTVTILLIRQNESCDVVLFFICNHVIHDFILF